MPAVKRAIYSGSVLEQEVFIMSARAKNVKAAKPKLRFKSQAERDEHKRLISRRHHARIVNANFSPTSLYSTLTMDDDHEVHDIQDAKRMRDNYVRRLRAANPDARIVIYIGRGKSTSRIHYHMISDGLEEKTIREKWTAGRVTHTNHLRAHNYYNGADYGQDYTGLANYLFDHWTPEIGGHRWKQTKNLQKPRRGAVKIVKRRYSQTNPPRAPKGYKLVEYRGNDYGYQLYKYVRLPDELMRC